MSNGKKYFGITNNVSRRWTGLGHQYNPTCAFGMALKKYGWDGFTHEIIEDGLTKDEALRLETKYIEEFQTNVSRFGELVRGYNMTDGGDGASGYIPPTSVVKKRAMAITGKPRPDMVGNKYREGLAPWNKGKQMSDETKEKMAAANRRRGNKPVLCIEETKVYESVTAAAIAHNTCKSTISACCLGNRKTAAGLHWRFVSTDDTQHEQ